ncbi:hypothetical protein C8Q77DRAFT_456243 [Trametes polyzona]|nr:hypothetical protein C8Q77DRAFT_456243 [Trametes polyzona]
MADSRWRTLLTWRGRLADGHHDQRLGTTNPPPSSAPRVRTTPTAARPFLAAPRPWTGAPCDPCAASRYTPSPRSSLPSPQPDRKPTAASCHPSTGPRGTTRNASRTSPQDWRVEAPSSLQYCLSKWRMPGSGPSAARRYPVVNRPREIGVAGWGHVDAITVLSWISPGGTPAHVPRPANNARRLTIKRNPVVPPHRRRQVGTSGYRLEYGRGTAMSPAITSTGTLSLSGSGPAGTGRVATRDAPQQPEY